MSSCLFCNQQRTIPGYYPDFTFNNKIFQYRKCKECKLVYLTPSLDTEDLQALYSLDYHSEFYFGQDRKYDVQQKLLLQFKKKGSLLDYGCGDASFLRFFQNTGYDLYGAEYNPSLVARLSNSNPDISFMSIASLLDGSDKKFDIIHLGDVLEHLVNPNDIIRQLKRRLAPDGIFFVEGPIEHNFHLAYVSRTLYFRARKLLQPSRRVSMRPFHVFFADRRNQLRFFEGHQLETLHYTIFEWAWPYPSDWHKATSLKLKLEYLIGKGSVASSHIIRGWGNRFYYIGTPASLK